LKYPHIATQVICSTFGREYIVPLILKNHLDDFFVFLNNVNNLNSVKAEDALNAGFMNIFNEILMLDDYLVVKHYFYKENGVKLLNMIEFIHHQKIESFFTLFVFEDEVEIQYTNTNDLLIDKLLDMVFEEQTEHAVTLIENCLKSEYYKKRILTKEKMEKLFKRLFKNVSFLSFKVEEC
jgi:hypothetical protein